MPRADRLQARANQATVVAGLWGEVGDSADRYQVEPTTKVEPSVELRTKCGPERESQACAAQALVREVALGTMRIEKRKSWKLFFRDEVMVDDDDIDSLCRGLGDPFVVARPAVAGHQ